MDSNDEYRPYHTKGTSRNGPYQPNTFSRKANGTNLPFLHHRCRREKNSYTLSKSQLLYEATTSIGIGRKKKRDRNSGLFFLVPWENAESSFEDSVVKKIMKNISYTL